MRARSFALAACFASCLWLLGCGAAPGSADTSTGSNSPSTSSNGNPSGVPTGGTDTGTGRPLPLDSLIQARVRNESSSRVDVTMRFINEDSIVNLSFVRVPPKSVTTVSSPEMANSVELSGLDDQGRALDSARFVYGVDFDAGTPAEYVVWDPDAEPPVGESQAGNATLTMTEPALAVSRAVGSTLRIAWNDYGGGPAAIVRIYLRPVGNNSPAALTPAGPAVSAQFDGVNDALTIVIPSVKSGSYEIVGQLKNGLQTVSALAPGKVQVTSDPRNTAPTLTILSPSTLVEQEAEKELAVTWKDQDPESNAVIRFALERSDGAGTTIGRFLISPPIAEDPDRGTSDSASLSLKGVLPGLYDLVGTIDDGQLTGTTRRERAVRVLPTADNDSPLLTLQNPATDVERVAGGAVGVSWKDSDLNDDARISLFLDADWSAVALDGNEQLLTSGIREDLDGAGDSVEITIPPGTPVGKYRLVGVIADGTTQLVTRAPGFVTVRAPVLAPVPPATEAKPDDGKDTSTPPTGGGDTADKNDEDKVDPIPPTGGGGGSAPGGSDPSPGDDPDKNDDPAPDDGAGNDPGTDDGTTDPGPVDPGKDDPGKDDGGKGDDPGNGSGDPADPDKNDGGTGGGSDPVDPTPTDPGGTGDGTTTPPVVVVIPPSDRPTNPVEVPGETGRPIPGGIGLLASNVRFGGSTTVDVTPVGWTARDAEIGGPAQIRTDAIPNDAWPRRFDVLVSDSLRTNVVSTKPIIVPQAVEILDLTIGGASCGTSTLDQTASSAGFSGVRITWFGGGTLETAAPATVEFWLSSDGLVPSDGLDDKSHRLIAVSTGSPNYVRTTELGWRDVASVIAGERDETDETAPAFAAGQYRVVAVARFDDFGLITTTTTNVIPVCQP